MRLINGEQLHLQLRHEVLEVRCDKPFGRDIEQPLEPIPKFVHDLALKTRRQRAVEEAGGDSLIPELLHLVLHQRDQRRDDDRQPLLHGRRELVAQALARAGRHDAQHIPSAEDILDHLALGRAELIQPEDFLQLLSKVRHCQGIIRWRCRPTKAPRRCTL